MSIKQSVLSYHIHPKLRISVLYSFISECSYDLSSILGHYMFMWLLKLMLVTVVNSWRLLRERERNKIKSLEYYDGLNLTSFDVKPIPCGYDSINPPPLFFLMDTILWKRRALTLLCIGPHLFRREGGRGCLQSPCHYQLNPQSL